MTNIVQQAKKNDEQIIRTISFQDV
jgi:hypothetical protein